MKERYSRWNTFPLEYLKTSPVLHGSDFGCLTEREGFLFKFHYNTRTCAILYTCALPLYAKLFKPAAIPKPTRKIYKEIHYLNDFINFVKHPFVKLSIGVLLAVNILVVPLLPPVALIGLSVSYGTTLLFAYLSSVKIKALIAKVDKIIAAIDEDDPVISLLELYELEKQNRILFSYWFPGNQALLFKYCFLRGLVYFYENTFGPAEDQFQRALTLAQNKKDEFICIRNIINSLYNQYCRFSDFNIYEEKVKKLIEQVPANQEFHAELTEKLEQGLKECYALIAEDGLSTAFEKFASLEFDAFTDELYPHLSIMYYQMEAALTLAGKYFKGDVRLASRDEERLTIARHSLLKVQWYLDTYYPAESVTHRHYVLELEQFWVHLPVIPHLPDRAFMPAFDGRKIKTIVIPAEKERPNKHVKIEFAPASLNM